MVPRNMHSKEPHYWSHVDKVNDGLKGCQHVLKGFLIVSSHGHIINMHHDHGTAVSVILDKYGVVNTGSSEACFAHLIIEPWVLAPPSLFQTIQQFL